MRLIVLLLSLPWWASLTIVVLLVALFFVGGWWFRRRFEQIAHDAVLEAGSVLAGAQVTVHAAEAAAKPAGISPYDIKEDDEEYDPEIDGQPWDDEGMNYYSIDVTIAPADPTATWDPTALSLVPADYQPEDEIDISEQLCPLHSAELFQNGRWTPAAEKDVRGAHRLRLLFAVHEGLRAVQFAMFVTYFGRVELPAPLPKTAAPHKHSFRR
jgi:hypothetical protein